MKRLGVILLAAVLAFISNNQVSGQANSKPRLAILPFYPLGVDPVAAQSSEALLRLELEKLNSLQLISPQIISDSLGAVYCTEFECALSMGEKLHADEVFTCKLVALGGKVIVQFMLIDVASQKVQQLDQTTSATVEDLDMIMKRLAITIAQNEPVEKTAAIGAITEQETKTPRRRQASASTGFLFGYLYPLHGYDNADRSFTMEFRTGAEFNTSAIGVQLAIRKGFAMNVFASYLPSKTDFCPFAGAGFGFHWVHHSQPEVYYDYGTGYPDTVSETRKGDGFELSADAGLIAFRTYKFRLMAKLSLIYTFNDYTDQAMIFTLGFAH